MPHEMPLVMEQDFTVLHHECDPWNRITPGSAMRRVQSISIAQCESYKIDDDLYARTGTAFLLSRLSLQTWRMPGAGERVRLQTRAYGTQRAVYQRATTFFSPGGEKLCEADARWVLVNVERRQILRKAPPGIAEIFIEGSMGAQHDMDIPKHGEPLHLANLHADYSLCDFNGHLNNTRYADILCDHLPLERFAEGPVRRMLLYYRSEIPIGTSFELLGTQAGAGNYFLAAQEGRKSFEGYVEF